VGADDVVVVEPTVLVELVAAVVVEVSRHTVANVPGAKVTLGRCPTVLRGYCRIATHDVAVGRKTA
jgi:hypothetical protein